MGRDLYESCGRARELFDSADAALGFALSRICFEGPEGELRRTEIAQPALFVACVAVWSCFEAECDRRPDAAAGHSVGEYAALVAAGSLSFEDGLQLVRSRGELMRDAAERAPGGMAAILGLDAEAARAACADAKRRCGGVVAVANLNGAGQVVISGETEAVRLAGEIARASGAKRVIPLDVSGPFHSPLMVTAGDELFQRLLRVTFRKPAVPLVTNVRADYVRRPDDIVGGLTQQVSGTVRWEESMQRLLADGVDTFVEFGPGDVLTGLIRRMDRSVVTANVRDRDSIQGARALLCPASGAPDPAKGAQA
jgi:[acyl-carrier-protein] S-malonyltransferase